MKFAASSTSKQCAHVRPNDVRCNNRIPITSESNVCPTHTPESLAQLQAEARTREVAMVAQYSEKVHQARREYELISQRVEGARRGLSAAEKETHALREEAKKLRKELSQAARFHAPVVCLEKAQRLLLAESVSPEDRELAATLVEAAKEARIAFAKSQPTKDRIVMKKGDEKRFGNPPTFAPPSLGEIEDW